MLGQSVGQSRRQAGVDQAAQRQPVASPPCCTGSEAQGGDRFMNLRGDARGKEVVARLADRIQQRA